MDLTERVARAMHIVQGGTAEEWDVPWRRYTRFETKEQQERYKAAMRLKARAAIRAVFEDEPVVFGHVHIDSDDESYIIPKSEIDKALEADDAADN